MGYDFQIVAGPESLLTRFQEDSGSNLGNFHLNIAGMGFIRHVMTCCELLDVEMPRPEPPAWPPHGIPPERYMDIESFLDKGDSLFPLPSEAELNSVRGYRQTEMDMLSVRSALPGKVPIFKFLSNDDWLIHPDEARRIAERLLTLCASVPSLTLAEREALHLEHAGAIDLVRRWAEFNQKASGFGGYTVG